MPAGKSRGDQVHTAIADKRQRHRPLVYTNLFQAHNTSKANGTGLGLRRSHGTTKKPQRGDQLLQFRPREEERDDLPALPVSKQKIEESGQELTLSPETDTKNAGRDHKI